MSFDWPGKFYHANRKPELTIRVYRGQRGGLWTQALRANTNLYKKVVTNCSDNLEEDYS